MLIAIADFLLATSARKRALTAIARLHCWETTGNIDRLVPTIPLPRSWLLVGSAVLIAIATAVTLRIARSSRPRNYQTTTRVAGTSPDSLMPPEPSLALPTFEAAPTINPKLIPQLRMPFPAGVVVLCCQGNHSEPGLTHSLPQNLHALDFSNRVLAEVPVVAAAAGTVGYVFDHAGPEQNAGGGYGNQVRLLHEHDLFTLYAHLDRVFVRVGDPIRAGQELGTMGRTGLAGDRHLHLSLHQGAVDQEGVPDTVEIPALLTYEVGTPGGFMARASGEFQCSSKGNPWSGGLYGSENDGKTTVIGLLTAELRQHLHDSDLLLSKSVSRRSRLWEYSRQASNLTRTQYRRFLEPLLSEDPDDPVTQYTWAVEIELSVRRVQSASRHLDFAEKAARSPALFEPWLGGWIEAQRGTISLMLARPEEAKRHFAKANELLPIAEIEEYEQQQWKQLGGND